MTNKFAEQTSDAMALPGREKIAAHLLRDEAELVTSLIEQAVMTAEQRRRIENLARDLVNAARAGRRNYGGVDAFMHEYGLSSEEGVILMCLAEALLRVPDAETADDLIDDKISKGDWAQHLGQSDSLFVNASTWGLMLTGSVIGLKAGRGGATALFKRMVARSGEPIIRKAIRQAMRIMGDQFVLGRNIKEALKRARPEREAGYRFSFDMLGEAARTRADADRYFARYLDALDKVAEAAGPLEERNYHRLMQRPSLSVKLSAIHPRFEPAKEDLVATEVGEQLRKLLRRARERDIAITIDAEEADRLDLTLRLFGEALQIKDLKGWHGFGLVVQAYGRRAMPVLSWLKELAKANTRRLPIRLVKGAYWDSEIKWAQEQGLASYPVFTRKANTDVSYLAAARYLLGEPDHFYPQFATHNAHSLAAIYTLAGNAPYEFQRLHGMGQALYQEVVGEEKLAKPCRIYAPVGEHEDLLAYLVRRLLENGANTSFVNRLADDELPISEIVKDPVQRAEEGPYRSHPQIPDPAAIYLPDRVNSAGFPLWDRVTREKLLKEMRPFLDTPISAGPLLSGELNAAVEAVPVLSPQDNSVAVGHAAPASVEQVAQALALAAAAQPDWDRCGGDERAKILERAAELYEENRARLMAVIVREAGKTLANALGDVREAVDFLRYYAGQAREKFSEPTFFTSPTGEENIMTLHGRGVFACISPWNFPLAIYTGQIAGALAAGNSVAAKPAEQTPLTAFLAARLLHEAGVPGDVLQFLPGDGGTVGAEVVADRSTAGVAFTGGTDTARLIQRTIAGRDGPIIPLIAETGGLNAMIVDSSALPEQVVRDSLVSAFDSAGQRCSALRVLFVQDDVADKMLKMLVGAAEELALGDPLNFATDVGPVIDEDAETTLLAHKLRMKGEGKTLLDTPVPRHLHGGTFVSPAIYEIDDIARLEREVFGPILHVVRYSRNRLDKVCQAINQTGYGLTLGLHSRIASTADYIAERVHVGNFYVNRNQIGAFVGVQPFGGEGLSGTGPKAGGPNYLTAFAHERVRTTDTTANGGNASLLTLGPVDGQ